MKALITIFFTVFTTLSVFSQENWNVVEPTITLKNTTIQVNYLQECAPGAYYALIIVHPKQKADKIFTSANQPITTMGATSKVSHLNLNQICKLLKEKGYQALEKYGASITGETHENANHPGFTFHKVNIPLENLTKKSNPPGIYKATIVMVFGENLSKKIKEITFEY